MLLAEKLLSLLHADARVFFCNSGTEANEAALKVVRRKQGPRRQVIVAADHRFHGRTMGALAVTGKESIRAPFAPFGFDVRWVTYGDAAALADAVDDRVAGVILEPTQGEGGVIPAPAGYLAAARQACDEAGALLVLDEIQSGVGRTGAWFAHQAEGVTPDVMTLAKGLGGGLPIGACIGFGEAGSALVAGDHGSTFGGNPIACAAALAVLDTIEKDDILKNVKAVGETLAGGIGAIDHPLLAGVRGTGLWLAAVLTEDKAPRWSSPPGRRVPRQRGAAGRGPARPAADPHPGRGHRVHRRAARHPDPGPRAGSVTMPRHFLRDDDLTPAEQAEVLRLARAMKEDRLAFRPLAGPKAVALLFDKPSLRTRVSFTVGVAELGGLPLVIDTAKTHIGRGETIADIARVLNRQIAAITWRTSGQDRIEELARQARSR